jgi:hypothetical protein
MTDRRWPKAFSRKYSWNELQEHDMMIVFCRLWTDLSEFLGDLIGDDPDDPLIKAAVELKTMVNQRIENMVAVSVPGLLDQIHLFGLRTETEIDDEHDLAMIRSIRAGIGGSHGRQARLTRNQYPESPVARPGSPL